MTQQVSQSGLKQQVGRAALDYVEAGQIIGVGTGSTVNCFIDALATIKARVRGAVSSSEASTARLKALGIPVFDCAEIDALSVYIDGADEIDPHGCMIKGGGAALTREKIVAAHAARFICIADESKRVEVLGRFPLPVEVIPMAARYVARRFAAGVCGTRGDAILRLRDGKPLITDNGQHILDVRGLHIADPLTFEREVSQWPGVVTVGVFALQKAAVCLLGTQGGVRTLSF
ncbi:MAG: ribose-5-phosphate isomerase RpiA [Burkholderiaceae bacterium]|nr:MAG: ribose-5-phosphate isomerase RpiA [Burkholderiaceae bacterium]